MKKIFSLVIALVAALSINATDYYYAGAANGWSNNNSEWKFVDVNGVLTLEVADLYGEFKITENGEWHPQHGAAVAGEGVTLGGSYNLVKCADTPENPAVDAPANVSILGLESEYRYKNAKLTLDASNPNALVITLVSGTAYDHSVVPTSYYLIGSCTNNWSLSDAVEFVEVNGVLTANIEDLNGTFKIIYDRAWGTEYASNGTGLAVNEDYALQLGGSNIALANPFAGYRNAVLTLTIAEDAHILKLVSGEFYVTQADWHLPGAKLGWKCEEAQRFTPVEGQVNTYELLAAEFGGELKVVYGNWGVEFGASFEGQTWAINTPIELTYPCVGNLVPATENTYIDVTVTIVVDYENAKVSLLLADENYTGLEDAILSGKAVKFIENGQIVILKNGVKYNVLGSVIE